MEVLASELQAEVKVEALEAVQQVIFPELEDQD